MKQHAGVCAGCSTGCSIDVEENQDTVYRLKPRENPHVNQWWMCDEGRYGYHHVHQSERQIEPKRRAATTAQAGNIEWSQIAARLDERVCRRPAARAVDGGGGLAAS